MNASLRGRKESTTKENNMTIGGAVIREQGIAFGIIIVKHRITQSQSESYAAREYWQSTVADFAEIPLILASQDSRGVFRYQGRRDIVDFLASIDSSRIPWKRYSVS